MFDICRWHGDCAVDQLCSHHVLAVNNGDYAVTVQSPCSHCAKEVTDGIRVCCVDKTFLTKLLSISPTMRLLGEFQIDLLNEINGKYDFPDLI